MTSNELVGQSVARVEDPALLAGRRRFGADLGMDELGDGAVDRGFVTFVRSTMAHGRLLGVDPSEAVAAPGVRRVVTAADLDVAPPGGFAPGIDPIFAQPLLAESKVRYVGEPIGAVVADSYEAAIDAAELVVVSYEQLPAVLDLDDALAGETLLFDAESTPRLQPEAGPATAPGSNIAVVVDPLGRVGATAKATASADVVVERRLFNPRMSPSPIEARSVTTWWTDDGELIVWASTQRPHGHRNELARYYRIEPTMVTVITPEVGGGFGGKNSRTAEELVLPAVAALARCPITWIETRSENLAGATQARGERYDIAIAGSSDGRLEAMRIDLVKDAGAYPITGAVLPAAYTAVNAAGPYAIPNVEFAARCVVTNRPSTSAFRGAGRGPLIAAIERVIDEFSATVEIDPAEVRRKNLIGRDQMPYETPTGAVYDEADYPADLERALTIVDYPTRRREQEAARAAGATIQIGIGIGCYNHMTVGGGGEEASITIRGDGGATIVTGTTTQGHGHATTWAQLASDVLAIDVALIEVVEGRTDRIATGVGAVGSRSLQTAGVAIRRSATTLVEQAKPLVAGLLEAATGDIVLDRESGRFHVVGTPARSVGWAEVAAAVHDGADGDQRDELSCGEWYGNDGKNTFPSGSHVAVVAVDIETGAARLRRFVAVDDAGVVVNPMIVEGQVHGGIAAGVGQVLGEEVVYDEAGNLVTGTFIDYQLATADELPFFETESSAVATSFNELGVKGIGESGTIGATPAVHNAIVDALAPFGVRHVELPCTSQRVWEALRDAERAADFDSAGVTM